LRTLRQALPPYAWRWHTGALLRFPSLEAHLQRAPEKRRLPIARELRHKTGLHAGMALANMKASNLAPA
jgi:hypothetical protein